MNEQRLKGAFNEVSGRVENAAGALADDAQAQAKGKAREIGGKLQQSSADAVDTAQEEVDALRQAVQARPVTALAFAVALGYLTGLIIHRR